MADDDNSITTNGGRLKYSQIIEASLMGVSNTAQLEDDLAYTAQVMRRAVTNLKAYERKVDFHHLAEHDKMKAMLTLNTIYALQAKVMKAQADKERERQLAAVAAGMGTTSVSVSNGAAMTTNATNASNINNIVNNNFNPFMPNRTYGGVDPSSSSAAANGGLNVSNLDASRVSAASPGRSLMGRY